MAEGDIGSHSLRLVLEMKSLLSVLVCACVVSGALSATWHSKDNEINVKPSLGDEYLDSVYGECVDSKNALKCFKYRALKYIHQLTSADAAGNITLWGPIGIETISSAESGVPLFYDTQPRSSDSEFDQVSKYAYRQLERFVKTHAITWTTSDSPAGARFIDTESPEVETDEARGKKKKKIKMLLPLLMFFKLKVLLKLILIKVIFIKKLLIIGGALLLPTILSQKIMKLKEVISAPVHHSSHDHGWSDGGGHSSYGGGDSYKQYGRMNKRSALEEQDQQNAAQDLAYQAYVYKV